MKRVLTILLITLISIGSFNSCDVFWEILIASTDDTIKIYSSSHAKVGHIDNLDIYDDHNAKIGYIDNLKIYNSGHSKVGYIDGKYIYNSHHRKLGYMEVESAPNGAAALLLLFNNEWD
ncbi:MAG: hypothetical protein H6598_03120 [Flavobacteriales bacterium]|nr:hypothetical protein [Flavobacteriales bacterium]